MKRIYWFGLATLLAIIPSVQAFDTVEEQIDHYNDVFFNGDHEAKITMLKRLQWSGLSDPRLYNTFKHDVEYQAMGSSKNMNKTDKELIAHEIRALGYSGNERYRNVLKNIMEFSKDRHFRNHAKKALIQLDDFSRWNQLIADSEFQIEGKSVEVATYMKMLSTNDVMVQRLAARAIFHEQRKDPDLLALTAKKLKAWYLRPGLDAEAQDTLAWLVKAVGENNSGEYDPLLQRIYQSTEYKKVKKYVKQYVN